MYKKKEKWQVNINGLDWHLYSAFNYKPQFTIYKHRVLFYVFLVFLDANLKMWVEPSPVQVTY